MTKIKVCGIKREKDIEFINKYLPDYIGLVFAESRRRVSAEQAKILTEKLSDCVTIVGVFVNENINNIIETAHYCNLDIIQLHGDESPLFVQNLRHALNGRKHNKDNCMSSGREIWKAIRVKDKESVKQIKDYNADKYLLDVYIEGVYGGVGRTFDWNAAVLAKKYGDIILAGGLTPQNAALAVSIARPFAVDVSSGVETEGTKDEEKIKQFIYSIRNNERR